MSLAFSYPIIFCAYRLSTSMPRDNRCALLGIKFRKTYARTCGFAHLPGDRVDQVQTIRQMSSVWLREAVQRVLKATFEIFCI